MTEQEQALKDRVVYIGHINEESTEKIITRIFDLSYTDPTAPIRVVINSPGGHIYPMFGIYDALTLCDAPIVTIGIGRAMSAAVILLACGHKGYRRMSSNCTIMIHQIFSGQWGKLHEIQNDAKETERLQECYNKALSKETGKSIKAVEKIMNTHKDYYLNAEEALAFGIADEVIK